jgi:hypothetical protein
MTESMKGFSFDPEKLIVDEITRWAEDDDPEQHMGSDAADDNEADDA